MALTAALKRRVTALEKERNSSTEDEDRIKEFSRWVDSWMSDEDKKL